MIIIGIDCGLSGAIAAVTPSGRLEWVQDMPVRDAGKKNRKANEIDGVELARMLRPHVVDIAEIWIEEVQALPTIANRGEGKAGHGSFASFSLGDSRGCIRGVCEALGLSVQRVHPRTWKKLYGLGNDKEASRALAIRLYPGSTLFARKKDEGRSEAALIARYGAHQARLANSFLEQAPTLELVGA